MYGRSDIYGAPVSAVDHLEGDIDAMVDDDVDVFGSLESKKERIEKICDKLDGLVEENKLDKVQKVAGKIGKIVAKIQKKDTGYEPSSRCQAYIDFSSDGDAAKLLSALGMGDSGSSASAATGVTDISRSAWESPETMAQYPFGPGAYTTPGGEFVAQGFLVDAAPRYPGGYVTGQDYYPDGGDTYITNIYGPGGRGGRGGVSTHPGSGPRTRPGDAGVSTRPGSGPRTRPGSTGVSATPRSGFSSGILSNVGVRPKTASPGSFKPGPALSPMPMVPRGGSGVTAMAQRPLSASGRSSGMSAVPMGAPRGAGMGRSGALSRAVGGAMPRMSSGVSRGKAKFGAVDSISCLSDPSWWQEGFGLDRMDMFGDVGLLDTDLVDIYADDDEEYGDVGIVDLDLVDVYADDEDDDESFGDVGLLDIDLISLYTDDDDDDDDILDALGEVDLEGPPEVESRGPRVRRAQQPPVPSPRRAPLAGVKRS